MHRSFVSFPPTFLHRGRAPRAPDAPFLHGSFGRLIIRLFTLQTTHSLEKKREEKGEGVLPSPGLTAATAHPPAAGAVAGSRYGHGASNHLASAVSDYQIPYRYSLIICSRREIDDWNIDKKQQREGEQSFHDRPACVRTRLYARRC